MRDPRHALIFTADLGHAATGLLTFARTRSTTIANPYGFRTFARRTTRSPGYKPLTVPVTRERGGSPLDGARARLGEMCCQRERAEHDDERHEGVQQGLPVAGHVHLPGYVEGRAVRRAPAPRTARLHDGC